MNPIVYQIIHLSSVLALLGFTFYAFAAPAETRKKVLAITGIASLLVLISGFGMISRLYDNNFAVWMIVKFVCWLGLSALAGIGYRRRGAAGALSWIALLLGIVAVFMVYRRPFGNLSDAPDSSAPVEQVAPAITD